MNLIEYLFQKLDDWVLNMMGDAYGSTKKPFCCYCKMTASGRLVFMGNDDQVVDNPFCDGHYAYVYKRTVNLLREKFPDRIRGELYLVQKWDWDRMPPPMPKTEAELLSHGGTTRHGL